MNRAIVIFSFFIALFCCSAAAADQLSSHDLDGTWKGTIGSYSVEMSIKTYGSGEFIGVDMVWLKAPGCCELGFVPVYHETPTGAPGLVFLHDNNSNYGEVVLMSKTSLIINSLNVAQFEPSSFPVILTK